MGKTGKLDPSCMTPISTALCRTTHSIIRNYVILQAVAGLQPWV